MEYKNFPVGYVVRPATLQDAPQALELFNRYGQETIGSDIDSLEGLQAMWQTNGFDLSQHTALVFALDGQLAAYGELWDVAAPYVHKYLWVCVDAQHRGRGIGTALAHWGEEQARLRLPLSPEGVRVTLSHGVPSQQVDAARLLHSLGFEHVRTFYQMRVDLVQQPPQPVLPQGIVIRSMVAGREEPAVVAAVMEAFRDHWGFVEEPFEQRYERTMQRLAKDPYYDPTVWFVAMDGDEVAGFSLCTPHSDEEEHMGWVDQLGVRRPWRRSGLGLALLHYTFGEFYRRGFTKVALGVDASSLTGATRLYERAGMYVVRKYLTLEKELRPGVELGTQTVTEG